MGGLLHRPHAGSLVRIPWSGFRLRGCVVQSAETLNQGASGFDVAKSLIFEPVCRNKALDFSKHRPPCIIGADRKDCLNLDTPEPCGKVKLPTKGRPEVMLAMRNPFPSGEVARYAGIIVGLASACLAVVLNRAAIGSLLNRDLSILGNAVVLYSILAFMAVSGIIVVLWGIGLFFRHIILRSARIVAVKLKMVHFDNLTLEICTAADLPEISRISAATFGPFAASLDRNRFLFDIDSKSYWKIQNKSGAIVGFYTLFRLTAAGTRAIKRGEFDITTCPSEYLRRDAKYRYQNIYVAGIYDKDKKARAMAWGVLNQRAVELRPKNIFARAATEDGLRILEHAKFSPLRHDKNGLGALYRR
jgi:hypothetical protein